MNKFRNLLKPKILLSGLVIATVVALGWGAIGSNAQAAQDCDNNAVMKCGYNGLSDFAKKYNQNQGGNVKGLYNYFGLASNELSRFTSTAQRATVHKDGRVILSDGTVIATEAKSLGRQKVGGNRHTLNISGVGTFYYSSTQESFAAGSIPAYVMINPDTHAMEFAALTSCGNPVWGKSPGYKCESLKKTKIDNDTYSFVADTYQQYANLTKLVYDFGDGQSKTITGNFGQKVEHTYKPGKFTAKVTAYFNVNGKTKTHTRAECTTPVEVPQPPKPVFVCKALTMVVKNKDEREYTFTVSASYANGPVLASADFNFGDGQSQNGVVSTDKKTATVTHKYSKTLEGDIKIKATVKSNTGLTSTAATCELKLTFKKDIVYCKPGIPVGDERCKDYCKPGIPVGDDRCKDYCKPGIEVGSPECEETPEELPATGPAEIIVGTMGMGSLVAAASYYRSSRRNLLDSIFKR